MDFISKNESIEGSRAAQQVEVEIVPAGKKHLYSITAMTEAFFPYANFSFEEINRRISTNNIFYFVALTQGHTAGFVDFELKEKSAQILGLAVLEEYRGKGIGAKLLEKGLDEIMRLSRERAIPLERIDLLVSVSNPAALAMYKKHGFETAGKLDRQLWGQEILVFSKKFFKNPVN